VTGPDSRSGRRRERGMIRRPMKGERRTEGQLRAHYLVERELADRLRNASREERRRLYASVYNELYRRVPHHPQLTQKASPETVRAVVSAQVRILKSFLTPETTFLEVGSGDCALSLEVAKLVKHVYAVDVSDEITKNLRPPANFRLVMSDGCSIPVPRGTVNVAYSNMLMEHLHPNDAFEQLRNIHEALAPGGIYLCVTPNRLSGPHDISICFDDVASGLHLKEYTVGELSELFKKAGFSKVRVHVGARDRYALMPVFPSVASEKLLGVLPDGMRRSLAAGLPFRLLLGIRLVGIK
jgi:SAM-dependent methyltransferase